MLLSKEALNKLSMAVDDELLYEQSGILFATELTKIIEKDLERLEVLEKKNQELRKAVKSWNDSIPKLIHENLKLKKAIEILKDHFKLYYNRYTDVYELKADLPLSKIITKKTYEILKEVLGYE